MYYLNDEYLREYSNEIVLRNLRLCQKIADIAGEGESLSAFINNHLYYGLHLEGEYIYFREYAPNATEIYVIGDFNNWQMSNEYKMTSLNNGSWELKVKASKVKHKDLYKFYIKWRGGEGERIPSYANRCVQDSNSYLFSAQVWLPKEEYKWRYKQVKVSNPLIYEVHIGMSGEREGVSTFKEFKENVLPRIVDLGYNTIQIMALQEHPYYGSFGYQVSNFFALSSRFGTPEEFKELVDEAHKYGIAVVMDIVHSHAVKNELEGLSNIDGNPALYFHSGSRGEHPAWGTKCFDYGKDETLFFLLSNCKYWLEEYHLDGFRFDGITSMIYKHHGLGIDFTSYKDYFNESVDVDALIYLGLANRVIKEINPDSITIAEEMSGMPGLAAPLESGGWGFDYRMSMGVPDNWIKWIKELSDEKWNVSHIWWELTNKRADEKTISYAECHDQAMVGDKTIIFRLIDAQMYTNMSLDRHSLQVDRGIALHKMIRLATIVTSGNGYLTFMGNEFGHPEWIDFPREGNGWSYKYAKRMWSLADNGFLRYGMLQRFDKDMIHLFKERELLGSAPISLFNDEQKQVMVCKRGELIFLFNFSPNNSYNDYTIDVEAGEYKIILDSDNIIYNGFGRNDLSITHFTITEEVGGKAKESSAKLKLYLPNRTAYVLEKIS